MERVKAYWKRFAASVTDCAHRYQHDVFYRTGWNVVLLQVGFTALLVAGMVFALSVLYHDVLSNFVSSIAQTLADGKIPSPQKNAFVAQDLEYAKQKNIVLASTGVLVLAAVFGFLITRLALVPTKAALTSQKQFVGNIAHELRTPLSIIKTNTEVALFNEKLDDDTREMLVSNVEELDRISDIINNLLSMNALLNPEKMRFSNVDLGQVVDRIRSTLADLAEHKRITIETRLSEWRTVWGNFSGVEQMVMNVAKNALNYTAPGGTVSIVVEPADRRTIGITIEDNGSGISEADLGKIFEPFYRGDRSRNRGSGGGSGLGLAIVSELVKTHKGRISLRSAVGKGTVVSLFLPEGQAPTASERPNEPSHSEIAMDFTS